MDNLSEFLGRCDEAVHIGVFFSATQLLSTMAYYELCVIVADFVESLHLLRMISIFFGGLRREGP